MTASMTGRCACGFVRYELTAAPMFVHCCHCLDCQRQTGSAFVINALIETSNILLTGGEPEAIPVPTDSGRPHDIHRCPRCKVAVWSDYGSRPYLRFVRVGTLETPHVMLPDVHIYTRSKVPWVTLPPEVPAFEVFYELKSLWPEEAQARRRAAAEASRSA